MGFLRPIGTAAPTETAFPSRAFFMIYRPLSYHSFPLNPLGLSQSRHTDGVRLENEYFTFQKLYGEASLARRLSACRKTSVRRQTCRRDAGELEGAAARLEWDHIPRSPCRARAAASKARTFPPWRGRERYGMQAVEKVQHKLGFFVHKR